MWYDGLATVNIRVFNLNFGMLNIYGKWYLPIFLLRDGPLTPRYIDSLIVPSSF